MSTLEQAFIDAIDAGQIEGVLIEGRTKAGNRYSKALGNRTRLDGTEVALSSSDLCFLASATKLLTTIAALQLCERGKLSLDADLSSQLSGITTLGVLVDWNETTDKPNLEPLRRPLTLRHLLTHSSGIAYEFTEPKLQRWRSSNPVIQGDIGVEARFTTPLAFQPGEGWMYGTGIDWAGRLVERATGIKLDEYFRKYIFGPVGVSDKDVSFFPVHEGLGDRMSDLNPKDPKGLGLSTSMGHSIHDEIPGECYGGSGMYGSATAYITVLESLLRNSGEILRPESIAEMLKPQLEPKAKDSLAEGLKTHFGPFFNMGTSGPTPDWGLGGLLVMDAEDESGLGKGTITWGGGINTAWFIDPTNEICGFVCPQLGVPADIRKGMVLKAVLRKNLKEQLAAEAKLTRI